MKKHSIKLTALVLALVLTAALALTGCGSKSDDSDGATTIQIAVPNDTTNEARALLLLQDNGITSALIVFIGIALMIEGLWDFISLMRIVSVTKKAGKAIKNFKDQVDAVDMK